MNRSAVRKSTLCAVTSSAQAWAGNRGRSLLVEPERARQLRDGGVAEPWELIERRGGLLVIDSVAGDPRLVARALGLEPVEDVLVESVHAWESDSSRGFPR